MATAAASGPRGIMLSRWGLGGVTRAACGPMSNTLQAKTLLTKGGASENKQTNGKRNKDRQMIKTAKAGLGEERPGGGSGGGGVGQRAPEIAWQIGARSHDACGLKAFKDYNIKQKNLCMNNARKNKEENRGRRKRKAQLRGARLS